MLSAWLVLPCPTGTAPQVAVLVFTDAVLMIFGEMAGDAFAVSKGLSYRLAFDDYPQANEVINDGYWNMTAIGDLFAALGMRDD